MKKKSLLMLLVAVLMAFTFTACGEKEEPLEAATDTETITTAITNMNEAKSMTYSMEMSMEMSSAGQTFATTTTSEIQYIAEPITMKMIATTAMEGMEDTVMTSYVETVDDVATMYSTVDDTLWYKQEIGNLSALQQYDAASTIELYASSPEQFTKTGTEEINGVTASKFEGKITEDNFQETLSASGVLDQLNLEGMDKETLASLYEGIGDMPIILWINDETLLPVRYEMDMTSMMSAIMKNALTQSDAAEETPEININKAYISMDITNYDNVSAIEIPEAAKNAEALTLTD